MNEYIALIKTAGYRVFIRPNSLTGRVTYCFYTDGVRIGYAQWSDGRPSVSTVHKANLKTGTGFQFADDITRETITGAAKCFAPWWASQADQESVKKYSDWRHFVKSSVFHADFLEV